VYIITSIFSQMATVFNNQLLMLLVQQAYTLLVAHQQHAQHVQLLIVINVPQHHYVKLLLVDVQLDMWQQLLVFVLQTQLLIA
jgi:hypothetical protein